MPLQTSHIDAARRKCCCILLDNATIHHSHEFVSRVVQHRAVVRYIPPYCWFLSPLDNGAFGALVRWLGQNYYYVQRVGIKETRRRSRLACGRSTPTAAASRGTRFLCVSTSKTHFVHVSPARATRARTPVRLFF